MDKDKKLIPDASLNNFILGIGGILHNVTTRAKKCS
jgi:hypothetical protein